MDMVGLQFPKPPTAGSLVLAFQSRDVVCDKYIHWCSHLRPAGRSCCFPLLVRDYCKDTCGKGHGCHLVHSVPGVHISFLGCTCWLGPHQPHSGKKALERGPQEVGTLSCSPPYCYLTESAPTKEPIWSPFQHVPQNRQSPSPSFFPGLPWAPASRNISILSPGESSQWPHTVTSAVMDPQYSLECGAASFVTPGLPPDADFVSLCLCTPWGQGLWLHLLQRLFLPFLDFIPSWFCTYIPRT